MTKHKLPKECLKHLNAIIKYKREEIIYDEFAYKRMQQAYRGWLKNLIKYGHPEPKKIRANYE